MLLTKKLKQKKNNCPLPLPLLEINKIYNKKRTISTILVKISLFVLLGVNISSNFFFFSFFFLLLFIDKPLRISLFDGIDSFGHPTTSKFHPNNDEIIVYQKRPQKKSAPSLGKLTKNSLS